MNIFPSHPEPLRAAAAMPTERLNEAINDTTQALCNAIARKHGMPELLKLPLPPSNEAVWSAFAGSSSKAYAYLIVYLEGLCQLYRGIHEASHVLECNIGYLEKAGEKHIPEGESFELPLPGTFSAFALMLAPASENMGENVTSFAAAKKRALRAAAARQAEKESAKDLDIPSDKLIDGKEPSASLGWYEHAERKRKKEEERMRKERKRNNERIRKQMLNDDGRKK